MENSNDTIGNRTRDLPVCSAVLQPTAPPVACSRLVSVRNIIRIIERWEVLGSGHEPYWAEGKCTYCLVGKSEGERSFRKPKCGRENNINISLNRNYMRRRVEWINMAQDRDKCLALLNLYVNLRVTKYFGKFFTTGRNDIFKRTQIGWKM